MWARRPGDREGPRRRPAEIGLVLAGARQPPAVHALAAAMNEALGSVGTTVHWRAGAARPAGRGGDLLRELAGEFAAGKIDTRGDRLNALYTAPADPELRKAFGKVKNSMVLALRDDETVRAATWRPAASHPLESWGDPARARRHRLDRAAAHHAALRERDGDRSWLRSWGGHRGVAPRARGLAHLLRAPRAAAARRGRRRGEPGRQNRPRAPDPYDRTWDEWLAAGVLTESAGKPEQVAADLGAVGAALEAPRPGGGIEPGFAPDYKIWDGRLLENAWAAGAPRSGDEAHLENAAYLSPATAKRLGVAAGDLVELACWPQRPRAGARRPRPRGRRGDGGARLRPAGRRPGRRGVGFDAAAAPHERRALVRGRR